MYEDKKTSKFDGKIDYREIIDKKEKVILAIGLLFVYKFNEKFRGTGFMI